MQQSKEITIDPASKEYVIVRLDRENLADVARLHARVYGRGAPEMYFIRKYDTAYTGVEYAGYVAYTRSGEVAAYYGVIPCLIEYEGSIVVAAQSADTMTDQRHRFKGMFVDLSNLCFALCRELGIRLLFGFPNENSYHGAVNKLGWKLTERMSCFMIGVNAMPFERIARKAKITDLLYRRWVAWVMKKYRIADEGVSNSVVTDGFGGIYRSAEYLEYKGYSGAQVIRAGSAKIWINMRQGLLIGDMEGVHSSNFGEVIHSLKRLARICGIRQIQFHCSQGTGLYQLFAAQYEELPSYPVLFQDFGSTAAPEKIKFSFADIDIF